jgi:hypothetical protein
MFRYLPSLLAGLFAAVLFIAVLAFGLGFLFMFLPSLPLYWLALSRAPKQGLIAGAAGAVAVTLITDLSVGVFFFLLIGLPVFYISQLAVLSQRRGDALVWFPVGQIFTQLTFYASGLIAMVAFYYMSQGISLEHYMGEQIRAAFGTIDAQYSEAVDMLAGGLSFLIFSMGIWLWGLALYGHAWVINRWLATKKKNIRPDFVVEPFLPSNTLLFALGVCAFASLAASPPMAFLGKALLVGLLLPYFFLGASLMHRFTRTWPSRRIFLFFVYFMTLAAFWPALVLAAIGLIHHIKHLSA